MPLSVHQQLHGSCAAECRAPLRPRCAEGRSASGSAAARCLRGFVPQGGWWVVRRVSAPAHPPGVSRQLPSPHMGVIQLQPHQLKAPVGGQGGRQGRSRREVKEGGQGGRSRREVKEGGKGGGQGGRSRREVKEGGQGGRSRREAREVKEGGQGGRSRREARGVKEGERAKAAAVVGSGRGAGRGRGLAGRDRGCSWPRREGASLPAA
jgi:hypothetical protein